MPSSHDQPFFLEIHFYSLSFLRQTVQIFINWGWDTSVLWQQWLWIWLMVKLCNCLKWMLQNWCNVTGIIANGRNKSQDIKYHRKETWTENFLQIIDFTAYKNGWRVEVTLRNPEPREKLPSPLDNDQWQPPLQWYKPWCFPLNIYIWWAAWVYDQ